MRGINPLLLTWLVFLPRSAVPGLSRAEPEGSDRDESFPLLKQEGVGALGTSKEVRSVLNVDTIIMVGIF